MNKQRASDVFFISLTCSLMETILDTQPNLLLAYQRVLKRQETENVVCDQSDPEERERAWHNER